MMLVLSLFPGIDLLGKGFEQAEYCVVRGPDLIWGGNILSFVPPPETFQGVIGGPPCAPYSKINRNPNLEDGRKLLDEFIRCVLSAKPDWWLMENVPGVPDIPIPGYTHQRLDIRASEYGLSQSRLRHFQFGSASHKVLVLERPPPTKETEPCCLASEGERTNRRNFADFCQLQGLPRDFSLPGMTKAARYRAVGNGVPIPVAHALATAIKNAPFANEVNVCICGCGRPIYGRAQSATAACRKRRQRRRQAVTPRVL